MRKSVIAFGAIIAVACAQASDAPPSQDPMSARDTTPGATATVPLESPIPARFIGLDSAMRRSLDSLVIRASEQAGGDVAVTAIHVESGARYSFAGGRGMFMGGLVRLPLAVQLLAQVDRGTARLDDLVLIGEADFRPSSLNPMSISLPRVIGASWRNFDASVTRDTTYRIEELLTRALSDRDPTAIEALLRYSGGPTKVQRNLRQLRVDGIRVDRTYAEWVWDYIGADRRPPADAWTIRSFDSTAQSIPGYIRDDAAYRFHADNRDRVTTDGVAQLLVRLASSPILSDSSRQRLFRTRLGKSYGGVLVNGEYAQFQDSWSGWRSLGASSNVGLVSLPRGYGRLAVAVMGGNTTGDHPETALRDVRKAVYAAFATSVKLPGSM